MHGKAVYWVPSRRQSSCSCIELIMPSLRSCQASAQQCYSYIMQHEDPRAACAVIALSSPEQRT